MNKNTNFLLSLTRRYSVRLLLVFFFNILSVLLTVSVFMMIEPFCQLLFQGHLSKLNPVSSLFVSFVSHFISLDTIGHSIFGLIIFAIVLYLFKNLFYYASQWVMASVRSDVIYSMRNKLYDKILHLPLGYFTNQRRGDVVSRAVNDTHEIEFTILSAIRTFMVEPITAIFYIVVLFCISVRLSLYSILLLPITFVLIGRLSRSLRKDAKTSKQRLGSLLSHVEETLSGLRIIKGFNAQRNALFVFNRLNQHYSDKQTTIYRKTDLASPFSEFLGVTVVMIVLVIGGVMVLSPSSTLSAGMFITYIALFSQLISPVKSISTAIANYKRGQSALDRLDEILSVEDTILDPETPVPITGFNDRIDFKDLSFDYDGNPVLSHVSFTLKKGETVALIGQSGAGKTTIADLLERFYEPSSGAVLLDGTDIRQFSTSQYRNLFSMVSQDIVLFNDSIYNNIVMGMENVGMDDVIEAAKVANIYDFIQTLPDGFNYSIGDRGLMLSGGQRQRISIARAVLRNTPILILDEATSAMDTESERAVQVALSNIMHNRTVLIIAHRLSTIQSADNIIVLDKGEIVEQGRHEQLMEKQGYYYKLIQIQQ